MNNTGNCPICGEYLREHNHAIKDTFYCQHCGYKYVVYLGGTVRKLGPFETWASLSDKRINVPCRAFEILILFYRLCHYIKAAVLS